MLATDVVMRAGAVQVQPVQAEAPPAEVKVDCNSVIQPLQVVVVLPVVEHLGLANLQ